MALTLLAATGLMLLAAARPLGSWNQHTHRQINYEAVKAFFARASQGEAEKYRLGPITEEGRSALHRGIAVSSSTLFVKPALGLAEDYQIGEERHAMGAWITMGGDWADEPHLYASVRHFYDPFKVAGVHYLTDQFWAHGNYDNPNIDQLSWALDHADNPFCLREGLTAYKLAMETPEGVVPPLALGANHFKTNLSIVPKDAADQRSIHLARAYRSLGETMHMIGDMTQPAHVRNDSHPMDEPLETRTYSSHVRLAAANPLIDGEIQPYLSSAGGALQSPRALAHQLAVFTNENFYSMDTISDRASGIEPDNGMPANAAPQFNKLEQRTFRVDSFGLKRHVTRYDALIAGEYVPLIQERLAFHIFAADHSVIHDSKLETFARVHGAYTGRIGPFHVPTAFARKQAAVLLPVAIHACADLMDLFFPTLELTAEYEEEDLAEAGEPRVHAVTIKPTMVHHQKRDPAWKAFGLRIDYSGPGALVITEDGTEVARRRLHFVEGKVAAFESSTGEMVEEPLKVYVPSGREALVGEEAHYAFAHGQKLHLEVDAGSRHFESKPYSIEPEVVVMPRAGVGPPGATFDFEASALPEGVYRFEWSWPGLAAPVVEEGTRSEVAPVLTELGEHGFSVKLFHLDGTLLDEDHVTAHVMEDEEEEAALAPTATPKPKPTRWVLVEEGFTEGRLGWEEKAFTRTENGASFSHETIDIGHFPKKMRTYAALFEWSSPGPTIPVGSRVILSYSVSDRSSSVSEEQMQQLEMLGCTSSKMTVTADFWSELRYMRHVPHTKIDPSAQVDVEWVEAPLGERGQSGSISFTAGDGSNREKSLTIYVNMTCQCVGIKYRYLYELRD